MSEFRLSFIALLLLAAASSNVSAQQGAVDEAAELDTQALKLFGQGHYQDAIAREKRALEIRETTPGPESPVTAASLFSLGLMYYSTGEYTKAEPLYQQSLAIYDKALGAKDPRTGQSRNFLALLYRETGAYGKAEPLYLQALAISEAAGGPNDPDIAMALNNLALLYRDSGSYTKAEPILVRALAIREKAPKPENPDTVAALSNLAALYRDTGAYAKAEPLFKQALVMTEKTRGLGTVDTAQALNNLAELYLQSGAYDKAEPLFTRALSIYEKARKNPDYPVVLSNFGLLYRESGAYAKAEALFQRALAIDEESLDAADPAIAAVVQNLGLTYQDAGAYAQAEPLLQRALAITEKARGPRHPQTAAALYNLAGLYYKTGEYAKAEPLFEQAMNIDESNTRTFLLSGSQARQQSYSQLQMSSTFFRVSFALSKYTPRSLGLGLTSVLQYKGRVLDSMANSGPRLRLSVKTQDRKLFDELSTVAQELTRLTFSPPAKMSFAVLRDRRRELEQKRDALVSQLSARSADFQTALSPITLQSVQKSLPADAVLAEWLRYEPYDPRARKFGAARYVVFLLKRNGEPAAVDLGPAQPIEALVAQYTRALGDRGSAAYADIAKHLFAKLVKPQLSYLPPGEKLLVSTDGALNRVPFAALMDEHGEYLAKRFEITYLTSGRDLLRMEPERPARSGDVVVANLSYGQVRDRRDPVFAPLPGTAAEAKALQALLKLKAQNVLTGDGATEARLKRLHGPRILHLATYAYFGAYFGNGQEPLPAPLKPADLAREMPLPSGDNPLLHEGLALSGANARHAGASDDGMLTAAEAAQLDLLGTQVVVLAAGETGTGKASEASYDLRRALVLAGAQSQLVSLWKVDDAYTQKLMLDYYQRLLSGEGRSQALRAAQLSMIADRAHRHPYYWAGFIPIGDWKPLTPQHTAAAH